MKLSEIVQTEKKYLKGKITSCADAKSKAEKFLKDFHFKAKK